MDGPRGTPASPSPVPATFTVTDLLRDRDVSCARCGYNLRNLTAGVCPECGTSVSLDTLCPARPRSHAAWTVLLVALTMGWLESFRYWKSFVVGAVYPVYFSATWPGWVLPTSSRLYWIGLLPAFLLVILFRKRFVQWPAAVRWAVAGAALVLVLLGHRRVFLGEWPYY